MLLSERTSESRPQRCHKEIGLMVGLFAISNVITTVRLLSLSLPIEKFEVMLSISRKYYVTETITQRDPSTTCPQDQIAQFEFSRG